MKLKTLLEISDALSWAAVGATVLAANGVLSPVWVSILGFGWIVLRLVSVPDISDSYVCLGVSGLFLAASIAYASVASADAFLQALRLRGPPQTTLAALALGYGTFTGSVVGWIVIRQSPGKIDPEAEELRDLIDKTPLRINPFFLASVVVAALIFATVLLFLPG